MNTLTFEHPLYLIWIAPTVIGLWLVSRKSQASLAPDQIHQSLFLRCLAASLLIIAATSPILLGPSRDETVTFLFDASRSISPDQREREVAWINNAISHKPRGDSAGVEEFGADSILQIRPTRSPGSVDNNVDVDQDATDIGQAISDASGVMDSNQSRQIVVLTDGDETSGSAITAASSLGVPISFVDSSTLYGSAQQPEVSIERVDLPATVHDSEPTNARAVVESNIAQTISLSVSTDGELLSHITASVGVGKSVVNVPVTLHGAGIRQLRFTLDATQDTLSDNNVGAAAVKVIGKPRILYLTDNPLNASSAISHAMANQSIGLDIRSPLNAPNDAAGFAGYDSVVLSDAIASEMTASQQNALQTAVHDYGTGFGMIGGPDSFIGGGWADTTVEQMLPVEMKLPKKLLPPPADIVVVLDASGSMSAEEDGVEKVQLAARAAVSLLGNLQPDDRICVLAVTEEAVVTVPFSTPAQALAAKGDIEGLEAGGGGIDCLTGLNAAYGLLHMSKAPIKHVIICPDTTDSEEQEHCVERATEELAEHHITTSVCGIGQPTDSDVPFQKSVAAAGGGQLFIVSTATDLPHFFKRDLANLNIPPFRSGQFKLAYDSSDRVVGGIGVSALPELFGYNISLAKPSATVPIKSDAFSEPIFAYQDYGLGRTFAFTGDDDGAWSKSWVSWPGYSSFWARVIRWSLRNDHPATFDAFADLPSNSSQGRIIVDAFDPSGEFVNGAQFQAMIATPGSAAVPVTLAQTAPGRYEAAFDGSSVGGYLISVSKVGSPDDGIQTVGVARAYSAEYAQAPINLPLMQAVSDASGGKIFTQPSDVWRFRPGTDPEQYKLAAFALVTGLIVFVLDIAWRLLGLRMKTQRLRDLSTGIAGRVGDAAIGAVGFVRTRTSDPLPQSAVELAGANSGSQNDSVKPRAKSKTNLPSVRPQTPLTGDDDEFLRGRTVPLDEDAFPNVASLDELRRRERAKERR